MKGCIAAGAHADIAVVDPTQRETVRAAALHSCGKVTPFEGTEVSGVPIHTLARGRFVPRSRALVPCPSGCGETTLLKPVPGLLSSSSGNVPVEGREIGANPVRIGMASKNPTLPPGLTERQNVMLPLRIVQPFPPARPWRWRHGWCSPPPASVRAGRKCRCRHGADRWPPGRCPVRPGGSAMELRRAARRRGAALLRLHRLLLRSPRVPQAGKHRRA